MSSVEEAYVELFMVNKEGKLIIVLIEERNCDFEVDIFLDSQSTVKTVRNRLINEKQKTRVHNKILYGKELTKES
eukprot:snap_masked-scaffold_8-processed-gene-10.23-mRNA-1 protein AED:1.00 eAED:1.00 QI:0/-1/0/0/-1/1/1/0/74